MSPKKFTLNLPIPNRTSMVEFFKRTYIGMMFFLAVTLIGLGTEHLPLWLGAAMVLLAFLLDLTKNVDGDHVNPYYAVLWIIGSALIAIGSSNPLFVSGLLVGLLALWLTIHARVKDELM